MNKIARFYRWSMDWVHYFLWKYLFGFIFRPLIVNSGWTRHQIARLFYALALIVIGFQLFTTILPSINILQLIVAVLMIYIFFKGTQGQNRLENMFGAPDKTAFLVTRRYATFAFLFWAIPPFNIAVVIAAVGAMFPLTRADRQIMNTEEFEAFAENTPGYV